MRWLYNKTKNLIIWIWKQLKDWKNLLIFLIVTLIVSCEVWVPYLLGFITNDGYWFAIGSACWAFWLAPLTPFIPICVVITLSIRKFIDKINNKKQ